jgi:alpha-tubulin suppressor-like RCC1 family protein
MGDADPVARLDEVGLEQACRARLVLDHQDVRQFRGERLACWGTASLSATPSPEPTPEAVDPANTTIAAGYVHTCALTSSGGQVLGVQRVRPARQRLGVRQQHPGRCLGPRERVSAIAAGGMHTCALSNGGGVKCWGYNFYGQLGNGTNTESGVPVEVSGLSSFIP